MTQSVSEVPEHVVNTILEPTSSFFTPLLHTHSDADLDLGLESLYSLESLGIDETADQGSIDSVFIKRFHDGIEFRNHKYFVELPWYEEVLQGVPSNYQVALATLKRVKNRLDRQGLTSAYSEVFDSYLKEGIIEQIEVPPRDFFKYIWVPHRPVVKTAEQVTTKIRPVFNCILSTGNSPSLNQASYPGVDLMASLFGLLLSFRSNKFVVLGDISKAFLQIHLKKEEDKNRFCFFWEKDGKLVTYRYATILFGLAVSPYVLGAVVRHHASQYPPDLCSHILMNNLYVDNLIFTHSSLDTLKNVFLQATSRMEEGGFNLCSWNSNNPELQALFEEKGKLSSHSSSQERVLGYLFNTSEDTLQLSDFSLDSVSTKRQLLSEISKVFDPLSLFLPVTIRGRLLMKKTWLQDIGWDDKVCDEVIASWEKLRFDLSFLKEIHFPRSCFESEDSSLSLNIFCDASTSAYGFVVYVCSEDHGPSILWSKGKVAPAQGRTLPCLELLSVFLALKCLPQVISNFPQVTFRYLNIFSDSQITLAWIANKGQKTKQIFVRNRIQDISLMVSSLQEKHSLTPQFRYVNTAENPADLITRGLSFSDFEKHLQFWYKGPEWLAYSPAYWPSSEAGETVSDPSSLIFYTGQGRNQPPVVNMARYSSLVRLLRVCGLLFKFCAKTRQETIDYDSKARLWCLKVMQHESFSKELEFLEKVKNGDSPTEIPDLVSRLDLFIDDLGHIISKGRLFRSNYYNFDVLNPILLGKSHHLTSLIVKDAHFRCKHLGIQATLTNLRLRGYWITAARHSIKKILSECIICKKYNNFAFQYPKFTNFSKAQVELFRPFKHVGVDFTKHWMVKTGSGQTQKMYILIYTCLNIRAIYLDLVPDMTSKSFVLSFQRFISRFGVPDTLYSDNARSFIQGFDVISSFVVSEDGGEFLRRNQIVHRRIPAYSPWVGSMWERMIRVVKDCLYKTIGRSHLEYFSFITTLFEIADAINSRPLTYTSSDNDLIPLTPNCLLKPHAKTSLVSPGTDSNSPFWSNSVVAKDVLLHSVKASSEKFEEFRTRWYDEYLTSLRETNRDLYQAKWENLVKVDDVVLVRSPVKDRPFWQMGVVTQLVPGGDGKVRFVNVRSPGRQITLYPLKHLFPLELSLTHSGQSTLVVNGENGNNTTPPSGESSTSTSHTHDTPIHTPASHNHRSLVQQPLDTVICDPSLPVRQPPRLRLGRPVRQAADKARAMFRTLPSAESEDSE